MAGPREFIVTLDQNWLSSETVDNVHRAYADGCDHIPEADRYPLYYVDSADKVIGGDLL